MYFRPPAKKKKKKHVPTPTPTPQPTHVETLQQERATSKEQTALVMSPGRRGHFLTLMRPQPLSEKLAHDTDGLWVIYMHADGTMEGPFRVKHFRYTFLQVNVTS